MTEQDKQALIEYYCQRDCGHTREECCLDNCHEIMLIEEFPTTPTDTDTISRQAAIDEIDEWIKAFRESGHKQSAADARLIQDGIIKLPSAQPEIIYCKDCRFWKNQDDSTAWLPCMNMQTDRNWFCGSAKMIGEENG